MAEATESTPTPASPTCTSSCRFLPTFRLRNWWLVKADKDFNGKLLAVAGHTSRDGVATRVFVSAPIIKRHDLYTLETSDGVHIILDGFINQLRTTENGFPSEVFDRFLFGFPLNWDSYAANLFKEVAADDDSGNHPTSMAEEPKSPCTPIQSTVELNELSEQLNGESPYEIFRTPENIQNQCNTKKEVCESARSKTTNCKRNTIRSVSSDPKNKMGQSRSADIKGKMSTTTPADRKKKKTKSISVDTADESLSVKRSNKRKNPNTQEKLSGVSLESLSFGRSRSGRLLLPPLEFWRNQVPVFNMDRSVKGIKDGASVTSPYREVEVGRSRKKERN